MNNSSAFETPQRQSKIGIILLSVINFGKFLKAMWPVYVLAFLRQREGITGYIIGFTLLAVVWFIVYSVIEYRNFSYFIDRENEKFVIRKGVINRSEIGIEKSKIQEANIEQPFLHKFLNIYELQIDSPGTDKKEVKVNAISFESAREIKNYLLKKDEAVKEEHESIQSSEVKESSALKISLSSLAKYALTANYLKSFIAVIAFGFYISQQIIDFLKDFSLDHYVPDVEQQIESNLVGGPSVLLIFTIIAVIFLIGILVNVVMTVVKFFGMSIKPNNGQFALQYGLFNTKSAFISRSKVQKITETQNYFQKMLNISLLKFSQISDDEHANEGKNSIPGCSSAEKEMLTKFIWKNLGKLPFHLKPNYRKLLSGNFIFIIIPIIIGIFAKDLIGEYWFAMVIYLLIAETFIIFSWLNNRMLYSEDFITVKSGIWDISKETIEMEKVQAVQLSQYFWQKKNDLGSVHFFTAGGSVSFRTASFSALKKIANYTLYKVESSAKSWM